MIGETAVGVDLGGTKMILLAESQGQRLTRVSVNRQGFCQPGRSVVAQAILSRSGSRPSVRWSRNTRTGRRTRQGDRMRCIAGY